MYFSKSTNGFYIEEIHGDNIPADAVEITTKQHAELMQAQSNGQQIIGDEDGYPTAINTPEPIRTKESLIAGVAAKRFAVETGGVVIAGVPLSTDRESQAQLNSAFTSLKNGLIADTPWKASDGSFTLVTLEQLEPIAQAVASHVRLCFSCERSHVEAINSLMTQDDLDNYDINGGWVTNA